MSERERTLETIITRWAKHDSDCKWLSENWTDMERQRVMSLSQHNEPVGIPACTCGLNNALDQHVRNLVNP